MEPSVANALPHFAPLLIFPLVVCAAVYGGWWLAGPFALFGLTGQFDQLLGVGERNMDPATTRESQLLPYKLSMWLWGLAWPAALIFSLWQMLIAEHLAVWEVALMAVILALVGQSVFIVGHELVHRRVRWERRLGEFLLASSSYPHYATEHVYIHHPHVCTPMDPGSAPKGVSLWRYLPPELKHNLLGAWEFEQRRLARRKHPPWHYTNAFWRYGAAIVFWYGLVLWMGGPWALLVYVALCGTVIFSMKTSNYVQHYGLRRVRMPSGRFESVKPQHAWSADYKFTNWMYYNMQRHADHHTSSLRYPLLQHCGESESPQLPGSYVQMNTLAYFPKQWFATIDPLLDRQRAQFYPEIDDWSAYDSRAFAARPDAFDAIAEIHASSPRLAEWINASPELLDRLRDREFTDLELPDGIGPDPEFDAIARRGLARLYWTRELSLAEMRAQLDEMPVQDSREAVAAALEWSNGKVFQIAVHVMRGSLSAAEAATARSRVAEASVGFVLAAVQQDLADRGRGRGQGQAAVAVLAPRSGGDLGDQGRDRGEVAVLGLQASDAEVLHEPLEVRFACEGGSALGRRVGKALAGLSSDNLLLAPAQRVGPADGQTLAELAAQLQSSDSEREMAALVRAEV